MSSVPGQLAPSSARAPSEGRITRALVWFHRWLGIATCLIFALWFASGAILLFEPFPSLSPHAQMELQRPVDLATIRVAPGEAISVAGENASGLRIVQYGDQPAYLVEKKDSEIVAVDARTGALLQPLNVAQAQAVAVAAFGNDAGVSGPFAYDQWIVHNRFDPLRPLYRIDLADKQSTHFYLSARTGELAQRTTRHERGWNWVGAVLHWVYFTPVRSSFALWDNGVWIISFITMLVAMAGTVLGIIRTIAAQRLRKPALSFFRPFWIRWHHLLGLFASAFVLIWIVSGWLSMDHGRLFSRGQATSEQSARYAGRSLSAVVSEVKRSSLTPLTYARMIQFSALGGSAIITAWDAVGKARQYTAAGVPFSEAAFTGLIQRGVASAWPRVRITPPERPSTTDLYALAEGWPASALRFVDPDGVQPDIVVDGADGRLLTVLDGSRKAYAWIYYGLHTFKFPGLAEHRLLRQIVVLIPLLLGFVFSITGVVIAYRRLGKSF